MKLFVASDHAGFHLKTKLIAEIESYFPEVSMTVSDLGTDNEESCDYPIFADKLVTTLVNDPSEKKFGLLICGSGIGMSIAANRHPKIRAALCSNEYTATLARRHNDANVLIMGARFIDEEVALRCLVRFLDTDFEDGRHARRLALIDELSKKYR